MVLVHSLDRALRLSECKTRQASIHLAFFNPLFSFFSPSPPLPLFSYSSLTFEEKKKESTIASFSIILNRRRRATASFSFLSLSLSFFPSPLELAPLFFFFFHLTRSNTSSWLDSSHSSWRSTRRANNHFDTSQVDCLLFVDLLIRTDRSQRHTDAFIFAFLEAFLVPRGTLITLYWLRVSSLISLFSVSACRTPEGDLSSNFLSFIHSSLCILSAITNLMSPGIRNPVQLTGNWAPCLLLLSFTLDLQTQLAHKKKTKSRRVMTLLLDEGEKESQIQFNWISFHWCRCYVRRKLTSQLRPLLFYFSPLCWSCKMGREMLSSSPLHLSGFCNSLKSYSSAFTHLYHTLIHVYCLTRGIAMKRTACCSCSCSGWFKWARQSIRSSSHTHTITCLLLAIGCWSEFEKKLAT